MKTLQVIRAGYGAVLLADPQRALRLGRSQGGSVPDTVVRIIGARHLLQATLCARWPTATLRRVSAATDVLHAATDVALAAFDSRRRRAAALDAAIAVGLAAATLFSSP